MGLLNDSQRAALAATRARAWTRPFTVKSIVEAPATDPDYYDVPSLSSGAQVLYGDWNWEPESGAVGSAGGPIERSRLTLNTSIIYTGAIVMGAGCRLIVDGIECGITAISAYYESSEIVVQAVRVRE